MIRKFIQIPVLIVLCLFSIAFSAGGEENNFYISTSYNNLLSNPEGNGMLDRLMKEAFRRIGLEAEIVFAPTEKSIVDVNAGLLDGEINRITGMEKDFPNLVRIPEPNMTMHFTAFSKKSYRTTDWEAIKDLYIGIVRGWKILERNTADFPHVIHVPTEKELFRMLHKDRLDIALYSKLTGYAVLHELGYDEIHHLEPPLESRKMYLYVHKKHSSLVEPITEALRSMKADGSYQKIKNEATRPYLKSLE
jgi:polar amino acid transport system substrate-binding protein